MLGVEHDGRRLTISDEEYRSKQRTLVVLFQGKLCDGSTSAVDLMFVFCYLYGTSVIGIAFIMTGIPIVFYSAG